MKIHELLDSFGFGEKESFINLDKSNRLQLTNGEKNRSLSITNTTTIDVTVDKDDNLKNVRLNVKVLETVNTIDKLNLLLQALSNS